MQGNTKQFNICILRSPEGKGKKEQGSKKTFKEIMAKMFPHLIKNFNPHIPEAQQRAQTHKTIKPHLDQDNQIWKP